MKAIAIHLGGDDALGLASAVDIAESCLLVAASSNGITQGECDHALIMFRRLRSDLLRARANFIQQAIDKHKGK